MNLDIRTMMVTVSALTFLFAGLLALAGIQSGSNRGVRYWALASLFMSFALGMAYFQLTVGTSWLIVAGAFFLGIGMSLQLVGIQVFKQQKPNWKLVGIFLSLILAVSFLYTIIDFKPGMRAMLNSLIYAAINILCARQLMVKVEKPLNIAYRFTAYTFLLLALVLISRALAIYFHDPNTYLLYSHLLVNPATFFVSCMTQLCLTFGFVLMLNYRLAADLKRMASRDSLTGAFNRRSLEEEGARLWSWCSRKGEQLAVMMIDIDHFKSINDRYGHLAGDEVLRQLTALATSSIRTEDYFARFGGEEFCILLPGTSEAEACRLAERLRESYAATELKFDNDKLSSTISIGVAVSQPYDTEFQALVEAGDRALYCAKQQGRNCVVAYSEKSA